MRVKASIQTKCPKCRVIKRKAYLYIICKGNPRHKQRQG